MCVAKHVSAFLFLMCLPCAPHGEVLHIFSILKQLWQK
ncbi:hypothetical protein BN931_1038 [Bifidobacterium animalis subsp. lactis CECT 8145]|nr:hypothetical protein W91_0569 [Bifidobacterium animalis subsp. lactis Bi-07]AJD33667.1 hypothetical protein BAA6_0554 [Bifidobacterium animalis]QIR80584.1 hypothetical protein M8PIadj_0566 [Bifidobacterium animalis]CDL71828.1 hypothetical protein BN931_1038 [Bifidobacterium animalis subsp. lactis CECT 8145]